MYRMLYKCWKISILFISLVYVIARNRPILSSENLTNLYVDIVNFYTDNSLVSKLAKRKLHSHDNTMYKVTQSIFLGNIHLCTLIKSVTLLFEYMGK